MSDKSVMVEAEGLVNGERAKVYGPPIHNFQRICDLWNPYLAGRPGGAAAPITPLDHALLMVLLKIARLQETPDHRDSVVDGVGYFGTYEKVLKALADEELADAYEAMTEDDIVYDSSSSAEMELVVEYDVDVLEERMKALLNLARVPREGEVWKLTEKSLNSTPSSRAERASIRLHFYKKGGDLWYVRTGSDGEPNWEAPWAPVFNKEEWEYAYPA